VGPRAGLDGRKISSPTGIRSPDFPARSQSLYRLSYLAHTIRLNGPAIYSAQVFFRVIPSKCSFLFYYFDSKRHPDDKSSLNTSNLGPNTT
jgi:hypothetical protein